jgi:hypothetical protein
VAVVVVSVSIAAPVSVSVAVVAVSVAVPVVAVAVSIAISVAVFAVATVAVAVALPVTLTVVAVVFVLRRSGNCGGLHGTVAKQARTRGAASFTAKLRVMGTPNAVTALRAPVQGHRYLPYLIRICRDISLLNTWHEYAADGGRRPTLPPLILFEVLYTRYGDLRFL